MAIIFTFVLLLVLLIWIARRIRITAHRRTLPPQAGGAWPLVGHLHLLGGSQPAHITLGKMVDKYGPIFTIWLGVNQTLVVSSWEVARECFTTNNKAFASRPKALALEIMAYNFAIFAFSPYSPYWRRVRKITTREVLSSHRLEMFKTVRESEVSSSIKETYEMWVKDNNVLVEMRRWFSDIALNVVCSVVVGKRFAGNVTKEENQRNHHSRKALRDFFDLIGAFMVSDALPFLRWLDLGGYERAMKKAAKELDDMLERWLQQHKQKRLSQEVKGQPDFMDVLLSIFAEDGDQISGYDPDTVTKATCLTLISLGGTDTTTVTLTWALALLLNNPETLKKAQEELDHNVGRERQVQQSDLENLMYLEAILKETMRLYPAAPLSVPHESIEDCTLTGYHIPAGTRLLVNLSKLHRDPNVWADPQEFRPERFLTTHKNVDVRGKHFELMPFGSGRRVCPGISFALQMMPLTLATLLQAFEIANPSYEPVDMTGKVGLTNLKATPLEIHLTPRLPAQAYA
ncbi:Cytochrome P450 82A3 [Morella rubra]|uniref:Cytochrome P450 82A3 n=1 Tax=Morella rubra TaxID=262757 RepID=A0A6A1W860_9ROSI|nr:Cytochrome P450 82A3 [Morella rubra]